MPYNIFMLVEMMYAVPIAGELTKKDKKKLNKELHEHFEVRQAGSKNQHRFLLCYCPADTFVSDNEKVNKHLQPYTSINHWTEHHEIAIYHTEFVAVEKVLRKFGMALPMRKRIWQWYLVIDS